MSQSPINQGFRWKVLPQLQHILLGPDGIRLAEWLANGQACIVKQVRYRTIYHVALPGLNFFLKHYPLSDVRSWLRQLVRPSKARGEFCKAQELARRGVATFTPLGMGERPTIFGPAESYLISQSLEDTEPLNTFMELTWPNLSAVRQTQLGPCLAHALGKFLGRMHNAGVCHHDLHAGNILVRLVGGDSPTFFLIDLHAVSLRGPLNWKDSRDNLVVFNRWFSLHLSRSNRWRCWDAYRAARRADVPSKSRYPDCKMAVGEHAAGRRRFYALLAGDIETRTMASRAEIGLQRDRRCLEDNRAFRRLRQQGFTGHVVADLDSAIIDALLSNPEAPFGWEQTQILKHSASATVAEIYIPNGAGRTSFIYKRIAGNTWKDALANLFRPPPALRAWQAGHALLERGVPTPRPLAVWHRIRHVVCGDGFLLFERIHDAQDLRQFLLGLKAQPSDARRQKICVIDRVARILRNMHRWQVSHRDLKAANILVRANADGSDVSVWLIDLVGVVRARHLGRQRRLQNLARLNASFLDGSCITSADRLRFLRTYMNWGLAGKAGWKSCWRAIASATLKKVRHNQRTGRPLK